MKKIILYTVLILIVIVAFSGLVYLLNQKSGKGALQVTSTPQSKVYLDGKFIGNTPLCRCGVSNMLPIGNYTIQLSPVKADLKSFEEKITINKSTLTVVDRSFAIGSESAASIITLSPLGDNKEIELMVISFPSRSNVFLDNSPVGITPLLLKNITQSDHDLKITKDGYIDRSVRIRTTAGFVLKSIIYLGINPNISTSSSTFSQPTPSAPSVTKILILDTPTGFLRVRESSSLDSLEINRVKPGETFELVDEKEGWFEIKLSNGKLGWISTQYAKKQ